MKPDLTIKDININQEWKEELKDFFTRREESFCSMCPANEQYFKPENPLLPVSYWKNKYDT